MTEHLPELHPNVYMNLQQELIALARSLPTTSQSEDSGAEHSQFGGNFYARFLQVRAVYEGRASLEDVFYIRMVKERFGFDLLSFYVHEQELCDAIYDALAEKVPLDQLRSGINFLQTLEEENQVPSGTVEGIQKAIDHPLGLEAVALYYWDRINPLLVEAYAHIELCTPNVPFLMQ